MSKQKIQLPIDSRSTIISISTGIAAGSLSYVAQLRISQYLLKACCIHSGISLMSSTIGGCLISLTFLQSSVTMVTVMNTIQIKYFKEIELVRLSNQNLVHSCIINLIIHKYILKQPFYIVLPSHIILPGSFANAFISLKSSNVSKKHKLKIQRLGHFNSCHHCGSKVANYISDHIPSTKFVPELTKNGKAFQNAIFALLFRRRDIKAQKNHSQVLYPQCITCSSYQAGFVSNKTFYKALLDSRGIVIHKFRLRNYCIFMFPIYLLLDISNYMGM